MGRSYHGDWGTIGGFATLMIVKRHRSPVLSLALAAASLLMPCPEVHAELVQAHIEGIVNASPIPLLNGQPWALTLILDRDAPEAAFTAASPNLAEYFN